MKTAEKPKLAEKGSNRVAFLIAAQADHRRHHTLWGRWHWRNCPRLRCRVWQRKYQRLFFKAEA